MTMNESDFSGQATAVERRPVHLRRIECAGYERADGLFDIEARLIDTKPEDLALAERHISAGEPIHQMVLCLTVDSSFLIHAAVARTIDSPYGVCGRIAADYGRLAGMRIEPGFNVAVKRMFKGVQGCSHITELLPALATTAFQVIWADSRNHDNRRASTGQPRSSPLGGCHALRLDGEVVRRHFRHLLPQEKGG